MNDEIERIEMTIEQAEAKIAKAEKVKQLIEQPLFKELITDGYLGDDAVRLTMNLKPGGDNDTTVAMLQGKASFSRYIAFLIAEGEQAHAAVEENRDLMNSIGQEQ